MQSKGSTVDSLEVVKPWGNSHLPCFIWVLNAAHMHVLSLWLKETKRHNYVWGQGSTTLLKVHLSYQGGRCIHALVPGCPIMSTASHCLAVPAYAVLESSTWYCMVPDHVPRSHHRQTFQTVWDIIMPWVTRDPIHLLYFVIPTLGLIQVINRNAS